MSTRMVTLTVGYSVASLLFLTGLLFSWNAEFIQRQINRWHNRLRSKYPRPTRMVRITGQNYVPTFLLLGLICLIGCIASLLITTLLTRR